MFQLAANLSFLFQEFSFLDRFQPASKAGFNGVEYLFPYDYPARELSAHLIDNNLQQVLFNLPAGNWAQGDRGLAAMPGQEDEFKASVELALLYAEMLQCRKLHVMSGLRDPNVSAEHQLDTLFTNLQWASDLAKAADVTFLIEPINPIDMPGYFLNDFSLAAKIIETLDQTNIGLQFDIYHCQRLTGNVVTMLDTYLPYTRHIQIANPPNRQEPNLGELNYEFILNWLAKRYDEWVGCEYKPSSGTSHSLTWAKGYLGKHLSKH